MSNKRLNAVITIGGAVTGALRSALKTTKSKLGEVGDAIRRVEREQKLLTNAIQTFGRQGRNVDGMRARYAATVAELQRLRREHERLAAVEKARAANMARRSEMRGRLGDALAVGAAVGVPTVGALRQSAAFNHELQLIGNTADMTREQVLQLGADILKASEQTGQSAETMQKAMGFLIAAGMKPDTARAMLVDLGRTATATGADIEDLAKAAFTLNDSLGVAPGQAMRDAIDTLAQAGKEGNVELRDMARSLPVLGAGFKSLKLQGREGAATMGAMLEIARKGAATADEAANNFENFLNKVTSPETRKKAAKMGLDISKVVKDAQKAGKNPLEAAVQAIARVTKGDQEKIGDLFQDMQVANFIRPMIQNWEEYERIKMRALSAQGVTDRDFGLMSETAMQQAREASNAFGRLAVVIGSALEPALVSVLGVITPVVQSLSQWVGEHPKLTAGVLLTVGALAALFVGATALGYAFTFIRGGMLGVQAALIAARPIITFLGATALPMVKTAILAIGRALLMNPIGLAVTAIAGAAFLIYKYWDPIKAWFANLWEGVKATFVSVYDWIVGKVSYLMELPGRIKAKVGEFFGAEQAQTGGASGSFGPAAPPVPPMAKGGAPVQVTRQGDTYHITQQPGEDAKALAERIAREQRKRDEVARRSTMFDAMPEGAW